MKAPGLHRGGRCKAWLARQQRLRERWVGLDRGDQALWIEPFATIEDPWPVREGPVV